ncbi:hypothetical protein IFR05_015607 [Cadophora sp. M221]|nr:hypothetical protein IFR05_015607 [Cadophora sp. M221]
MLSVAQDALVGRVKDMGVEQHRAIIAGWFPPCNRAHWRFGARRVQWRERLVCQEGREVYLIREFKQVLQRPTCPLPGLHIVLGQRLEIKFLAGHALVFHDLHQARRHVLNIRLQSWLNLVWMCYKGMLLRYPKVAEAVPIKTAIPEKFNDHLNVSNQLQAAADINGYSQSG